MARRVLPLQAGTEEAGRVFQRGAPVEGRVYRILVGLAGANDPVVMPHRQPLHFRSATTWKSACWVKRRIRLSIGPLQSSRSLILASILRDGELF